MIRFDPMDQRLAACEATMPRNITADVEHGEVYCPAAGRVVDTTAAINAVYGVANRLEFLSDTEIVQRFEWALSPRYVQRFPLVHTLTPAQWLECISEAQKASIIRAVYAVEHVLGTHRMHGSEDTVVWTEESRAALTEAYGRLRSRVQSVAADLAWAFEEACSDQ